MTNITQIASTLTLLQQAEAEVKTEANKVHLVEMRRLVQQRESTKKILKGIEVQIEDLAQKVVEGTN
jgi:hypothetical protein